MPLKFSMENCAKRVEKRPAPGEGPLAKIPRAGDVVFDALVPKTGSWSTRPAYGPVVVCIYKYTSNAADLLPQYVDKPKVSLYQESFFFSTPSGTIL